MRHAIRAVARMLLERVGADTGRVTNRASGIGPLEGKSEGHAFPRQLQGVCCHTQTTVHNMVAARLFGYGVSFSSCLPVAGPRVHMAYPYDAGRQSSCPRGPETDTPTGVWWGVLC